MGLPVVYYLVVQAWEIIYKYIKKIYLKRIKYKKIKNKKQKN